MRTIRERCPNRTFKKISSGPHLNSIHCLSSSNSNTNTMSHLWWIKELPVSSQMAIRLQITLIMEGVLWSRIVDELTSERSTWAILRQTTITFQAGLMTIKTGRSLCRTMKKTKSLSSIKAYGLNSKGFWSCCHWVNMI